MVFYALTRKHSLELPYRVSVVVLPHIVGINATSYVLTAHEESSICLRY